MRRLLLLGLLFTAPAFAQVIAPAFKNQAGQVQQADAVLPLRPDGTTAAPPVPATSTTTNGAIATASTFQSALAANANRKGCMVVNNSAAAELVYLGTPGSATAANAIPLPAGGTFNCGSFQGTVLTDQISITSATQGATYVVVAQ